MNMYLRSDKVSLCAKKVRVPNAQKTTKDWNVLLNWSLLEVLVHGVGTSKELVKVVVSNVQADTETNGGPNTVTTSNPVGETKHVLLVDTKLLDLLNVGGESDEVLGDVRPVSYTHLTLPTKRIV